MPNTKYCMVAMQFWRGSFCGVESTSVLDSDLTIEPDSRSASDERHSVTETGLPRLLGTPTAASTLASQRSTPLGADLLKCTDIDPFNSQPSHAVAQPRIASPVEPVSLCSTESREIPQPSHAGPVIADELQSPLAENERADRRCPPEIENARPSSHIMSHSMEPRASSDGQQLVAHIKSNTSLSGLDEVFIFVNPSSGGNRASLYLTEFGSETASGRGTHIKVGAVDVRLRVFNIRDGPSGGKPGVLQVKDAMSTKEKPVRVMVAGGDGTVSWLISEMIKTSVDMQKVAVGHIPFGTGNDFARATAWGPGCDIHPIGTNRKNFLMDLCRWMSAEVNEFDVWQVSVTAAGEFQFVHGGEKSFVEQDKAQHGIEQNDDGSWRMTKPMINYFSFGTNERIGLGFDKNRTQSRLGNNLRYTLEGVKKLTLRPAPLVSDLVTELILGPQGLSDRTAKAVAKQAAGVIGARQRIAFDPEAKDTLRLAQKSAALVFLNIPSFGGGADPWTWARNIGVANQHAENDRLEDCEQNFGDGKLEVLTYSSAFKASTDVVKGKLKLPVGGGGLRVASSNGPFVVDFRDPEKSKYTSESGRVYFQVDGEYFIGLRPRETSVNHWMTVRVLCNTEPARGCC